MLALGPCQLDRRIGHGGMAEVWSGKHRRQGLAVAVKVITRTDVHLDALRAAVRNEVRTMAGLDHPDIVMLFDWGEVTEQEERASEGRLRRGSPYLVMERADGGTAAALTGRLTWNEARDLLLSVLGSLGHAHARGVLHRDVKPSNVLCCGRHFKLSDFGVALRLQPDDSAVQRAARIQGTPAYMAPEQFVGQWKDYGPATDLYALGCLAYALLGGEPPFGRQRDFETMYTLHAEGVVAPIEATVPLPEGFDRWLRRLLRKRPSRRFQRAIDATRCLLDLGSPSPDDVCDRDGAPSDRTPGRVVTLNAPTVQSGTAIRALAAPLEDAWTDDDALSDPEPEIPPLDDAMEDPGPGMSALAAGLGIHGLRVIPMVGRPVERKQLWDALQSAWRSRQPQLWLLEGAAGCGKTRLAQWLCERAHELGSVEVLHAVHSPRAGPGHGLAPMVARHLRTAGLDRRELVQHIGEILTDQGVVDHAERDGIVELVAPASRDAPAAAEVRFASASERHVLVSRLVQRLGSRRPVIVWLEDVQWGLDAISFADHLLRRSQADVPVMIVMTARTEALAEHPEASQLLEECMASASAQRLAISPLPAEQWPSLLRRLLRLEEELARRVATLTQGSPLFAVHLVDDLVEQGKIEAGPNGLQLHPGAHVTYPADLSELWRTRIDHVMKERSRDDDDALELAAALGQEVDGQEWHDACAAEGFIPADDLLDLLLARRLAVAGQRGPEHSWTFVHGMLRESLEERSRRAGRAQRHHAACARMLRTRRGPGIHERLGRHWAAAGKLDQSVGPLRRAARERLHRGDYAQAEALLGELEATLSAAGRRPSDSSWGHSFLLRCRVAMMRGHHDDALAQATRTEKLAREHGWLRLLAEALVLRGMLHRTKGHTKRARELIELGRDMARELDDDGLLAEALDGLGRVLLHSGELDRAESCWHEARELYQSTGDRKGAAAALWSLAHVSSYLKRFELAERYNRGALEELERLGDRWSVARCVNTAGELARYRGDLDAAEQHYRRAGRIMRVLGADDSAAICSTNVARVLIDRRRFAEARRQLERGAAVLEDHGRLDALAWIHVALLPCCAAAEDWDSWALHWANATFLLDDSHYLDLDIAEVAQRAGDLAVERHRLAEAEQAYGLALKQWSALGRAEEAQSAEQRLRSLRSER